MTALDRPTLCVDFGTANSKAAVALRMDDPAERPPAVRLLAIGAAARADNPLFLPSAVFLDGAHMHFAGGARRASAAAPGRKPVHSFKMLLAAADAERALDRYLPRGADPDRLFLQRDLIVLYLAYLLSAVRAASLSMPDLAMHAAAMRIRYAHPGWRGRPARVHAAIARLFDEADHIAGELHDVLLAGACLPYGQAMAALQAARAAAGGRCVEGAIFEGTAAAACHLAGARSEERFALVIDVGAGTTDIAGFEIAAGRDGVAEIEAARTTIDAAGDHIDSAVLNLALAKAGGRASTLAQSRLWAMLAPQARELKETIFELGEGAIRTPSRVVRIKARELVGAVDFKEVVDELSGAYAASVHAVAERAGARGAKVMIFFTGGGARLPFLAQMAREGGKGAHLRPVLQPLTPAWIGDELGPIPPAMFPMLAVAIGGAAAPASSVLSIEPTRAAA